MKRIIIMLLIACIAVATVTAQKKRTARIDAVPAQQNYPVGVRDQLNSIIDKFGRKDGQVYSVSKNPNTGIVELSQRIARFSCPQDDPNLKSVAVYFMQDEPYSYQIQHITPGSRQMFSIRVVSNGSQPNNTLHVRTSTTQEMWLMCAKNPDNPQLRDAYAIVWEPLADGLNVEGTVFMVSSLRPDLYTQSQESSRNVFRIEGRVGDDLTDSLYVVYMADTSEELDKLADDAFMEYMPVVNRRFSFSVEIDKPKVGRIRTVMPDGSLCHLWTNLDFVPGETYHITTHNGYYDEDRDYERRVGRLSGKSLLNRRQVQGIDDVSIVDDDDVMIEDTICANITLPSDWELSPALKMQLEVKGSVLDAKRKSVITLYQSLDHPKSYDSWVRKGLIFDQITKQNKEVNVAFQDMLKLIKELVIPADKKTEMLGAVYTELMNFYTEQNKGLTEMMSSGFQLPKSAQKTQKALNKYIEKYMTEMTKLMSEMK
jgi:hypothetical protein